MAKTEHIPALRILETELQKKNLSLSDFNLENAITRVNTAIAGSTPSFLARLTTTDKVVIVFSTLLCIILLSVGSSFLINRKIPGNNLIMPGIKMGAWMLGSTPFIGLITALFIALHMQPAVKNPAHKVRLEFLNDRPYLNVLSKNINLPLDQLIESRELPSNCRIIYFGHQNTTLITEATFQARGMQYLLYGLDRAAITKCVEDYVP